MNSRDTILRNVREALGDLKPRPGIPAPPTVWPVENLGFEEAYARFQTALESVQGEAVRCTNIKDATEKIAALLQEVGAKQIGVLDRPLSARLVADLDPAIEKRCAPADPQEVSPKEAEKWDAGILSPEFLLADTGSCVFSAPTAFERLLCYIVPLGIVVASKNMMRENMPHLWAELTPRFGSEQSLQQKQKAQTSGEFLIMTGPSRTADIEKVLILGVHGPKRLVVFVIEEDV